MPNVCETSGARAYVALPAWEAVIVHEPAPVRWTRLPDTVQLSAATNDTGRPDDAVPLTVKSASPNVLPASCPNVIVWLVVPPPPPPAQFALSRNEPIRVCQFMPVAA